MRTRDCRVQRVAAVLLVLASGSLLGCGSSGACVYEYESTYSYETKCSEDVDQDTCDGLSNYTWHDGDTCADLGYTDHCPGTFINTEKDEVYCLP